MTRTRLSKLAGSRGRFGAVLRPLLDILDPGIGLQDADGSWIVEAGLDPANPGERYPVLLEDEPIGWVAGSGRPEYMAEIAGLVSYAMAQETEKRSLATEVLERYRELNLLYTLSEKLAATLQPAAIAGTALDEAGRLIEARAGLLLSVCGDAPCPELMAAFGPDDLQRAAADIAASLVQRVLQSRQPEVENDVQHAGVSHTGQDGLSLLCAPLKTEQRVVGALLLAREPSRPFSAGELKLLNSIALQAGPALEIASLHEMAVEKARMERELQMARQVQANLIPGRMPQVPGWQFAAEWRPALEVAGDYFDLIPGEDGQLDLVIADVADKGMPAALFMVFTRSTLRAAVNGSTSPAEGLARANHLIALEAPMGLFVTLFYARLNTATGELTYVNAGHNPPLLHRQASDEVIPLTRTGMALGLMGGAGYQQATVRLQPGDLVLFYTDGLTEAFDGHREQFGMERLAQVLHDHHGAAANDLLQALQRAVDRFTGGAAPSDDMTLLALKRL